MKSLSLVLGLVATLAASVLLTITLAECTHRAARFSPRTIHRIGMCSYGQPARNEADAAIAPDLGHARFAGGSAAQFPSQAVIPNSLSINP